jgi:hypothetical protein
MKGLKDGGAPFLVFVSVDSTGGRMHRKCARWDADGCGRRALRNGLRRVIPSAFT